MKEKRFLTQPVILLLLLLTALCSNTFAAGDPLGLGSNSNDNSLGLASSEASFLRVEEAYQVSLSRLADNQIALDWQIAPGYYMYKDNFTFKVNGQALPATYEPGIVKYDEYFEQDLEIYHDRARVVVSNLPNPPYQLQVRSQGCADAGLCYPPYKQYFDIKDHSSPIDEVAASPTSTAPPSQSGTNNGGQPFSAATWLTSLLLALVGGMILNLMPCVFPVLSIKALSLANSQQSNHKMHLHGWLYSAGCVATFVAIAVVMLALRAGGAAIGWGFQLQSPVVIGLLLYLFFVMGLSLSGAINLGSSFMGLGQNASQGTKLKHSFMTGALASVVASPCTAPMMGAALGYAITQPPLVALSVFAALGFGMALPFLLLTYIPAAAAALPKPGPWMENLKRALAFPMYLSCIWLLWVLANQTNSNHVALIGVGLVLIAFGLWLFQHLPKTNIGRKLGQVSATACVVLAAANAFSFKPTTEDPLWQDYSPERLASLRADGQAVFVNLTASWCITCLANERIALNKDSVRNTMAELNIQGLKGDWTNADPKITQLLQQYGRSGVPLYLYFPSSPDTQAVVLPQLLTPEIILHSFEDQENANLATISDI